MNLEQRHLPVVTLLWHKVEVAVNRAFAHARLKSKLMNWLFAIVCHIATNSVWSHPGWAGYMVSRKAFPDSFGDIKTEGLCNPL